MGALVVVEFVTLDGVMQGFGDPDEDRDGGFEHGGWGVPYFDDVQFASAVESLSDTSAYLFGRRTYEKMVAFWPHQPAENPMAAHLNRSPKYVASQSLQSLDWENARLLEGGLADGVKAAKAELDGNLVVLGSGELVQSLVAEDLVDGYRLFLHPLALGTGKRLFRSLPQPMRLRLLNSAPTSTGVLMLSYDVDRTGGA